MAWNPVQNLQDAWDRIKTWWQNDVQPRWNYTKWKVKTIEPGEDPILDALKQDPRVQIGTFGGINKIGIDDISSAKNESDSELPGWYQTALEDKRYDDELAYNRSLASSREVMRFNAEQADLNRRWQEQMSNTAYQRATADMRAAGLNPILAYSQGGAAVGSGSTASASAVQAQSSGFDYTAMQEAIASTNAKQAQNISSILSLVGSAITAYGIFKGKSFYKGKKVS